MQKGLAPAVLLLAIAGIAGWLWLGGEDGATPPPAAQGAEPAAAEPGGDAAVERAPVGQAPTGQPADPESSTAAGPGDLPDQPPDTTVQPNVVLEVRDAATNAPLADFHYGFRHAGATVRGAGESGTADLVLPPGARGELLVEAAAHVPFRLEFTTPAATEPAMQIDAFLDPAAVAGGIEIVAVDIAGAAVADVRVEAWRLPESGDLGDWKRGRPLWSRRTSDPNGRYVLPELQPGHYGVRLLATDGAGELLPLLAFERTFALTGSNGFVERAVLEPGCVLGLELVDYLGQQVDPRRHPITLDLRLAGGPEDSRRWVQHNERGRFAADDAPPAPGVCWLDEAVPPGLYQLSVGVEGSSPAQRQLALRPGERQQERIVVRVAR